MCLAAKYIGSGSGLVCETSSGQTKTAQRSVKLSASNNASLSQRGLLVTMPQGISWLSSFSSSGYMPENRSVSTAISAP